MARDPTKLTSTDARVFALLQDGPLTARQAGREIHRAENTAFRSLQRLALHGLAAAGPGSHKDFAQGSPAFAWTATPGATFPGPAPRQKYGSQVNNAPRQIRREGALPAEVAQSFGLAGLVQQMAGKS